MEGYDLVELTLSSLALARGGSFCLRFLLSVGERLNQINLRCRRLSVSTSFFCAELLSVLFNSARYIGKFMSFS